MRPTSAGAGAEENGPVSAWIDDDAAQAAREYVQYAQDGVVRFDYETEVLGRLDHPGIAKVFGAGTADVGMGPQPYFVMELVHGKCLDEFVRDERLSTNQRLKLLIDICNAVHHAHTKGVIHRDLKPSNVLVTLHDGVLTVKDVKRFLAAEGIPVR